MSNKILNLYKIKLKDGGARSKQYVVAKDLPTVSDVLRDTLDTSGDTEWCPADIVWIKLIEKDVQVVDDDE